MVQSAVAFTRTPVRLSTYLICSILLTKIIQYQNNFFLSKILRYFLKINNGENQCKITDTICLLKPKALWLTKITGALELFH